jgi:hypothetical protein
MNGVAAVHSPVGQSAASPTIPQTGPLGPRNTLQELHSRHHSYEGSYPQTGPMQQGMRHERAPSSPRSAGHSTQPYATPHAQGQATTLAPKEKDNDGPYKTEMVARMESLKKGDRVLPPCDRCRRLHMDCIKNLTACAGCTKKHAKCSWRDVRDTELFGPDAGKIPISNGMAIEVDSDREPSVGLRPDQNETNEYERDAVLVGMASARALALEGLHAAAEAQAREGRGTPEERDGYSPTTTHEPAQNTYSRPGLEPMRYDIARLPSPRGEADAAMAGGT